MDWGDYMDLPQIIKGLREAERIGEGGAGGEAHSGAEASVQRRGRSDDRQHPARQQTRTSGLCGRGGSCEGPQWSGDGDPVHLQGRHV